MDLYAVLGLQPGASIAEIKRAYRRLARRYHPGINPGDRSAEALFRRITEAYETLTDPARRQQYDAGGPGAAPGHQQHPSLHFTGFDFSVAVQGQQAATFTELFAEVLHPLPAPDAAKPERGPDVHATLAVSFLEALRGVQRQVIVTRQEACAPCRGSGRIATAEAGCPHCRATGSVRWARGHMVFTKPCAACGGAGRQRDRRCEACVGHGRVVRSESIEVPVPPGTADGTTLRVAARGHAGRHGGPSGDLVVHVRVAAHRLFRREGEDLHLDVPIAVHEAVLGARIEVPTPDGPVRVTVPPGTQSGRQFRLPGRGVPSVTGGRGDLLVHARIVLPERLDERSRELIREFGRLNSEDVRKALRAE